MQSTFDKMNSMYRYQRYFYNATRKYYLLGRDKLIREMQVRPRDHVLEIGCGTGRNLIALARNNLDAEFYGIDASSAMIETARADIKTQKLTNISLKTALAEDFGFGGTFGLDRPFDTVFFSYSITMIPNWKQGISTAFKNIAPTGRVYIVDFYDQRDLPVWFGTILRSWLRKFHVQFWDDLMPHLESLEDRGLGNLEIVPIARRYAFLAKFEKNGEALPNLI